MRKPILDLIRTINKYSGHNQIFIVGGFIRDYLLNRDTNDIDFVIMTDAKNFAKKMSNLLNGTFVLLDSDNGIYRVVVKSKSNKEFYNIDFSEIRRNNIVNDLSLRDFTINAMAVKCENLKCCRQVLKTKDIIDPFAGRNDLRKRIIRRVSDKIFVNDPLRLIRAYRLKAELKFNIEQSTKKLIGKYARLIKLSAAERIHDELIKILSTDNSVEIITELDMQKILEQFMPEIKKMKKSARKFYYHREGLWQHSKESLSALEYVLNNLKKYADEYTENVTAHLSGKKALLKFVTLLHDAGKPQTAKVIDGRTRFFGHEEAGENIIKVILGRLKISKKEIQIAQKMVKNHMRPASLSRVDNLTERAIYRYFRDMGDESIDLLLLSLADISSYLPPFSTKKRGKTTYKEIKAHRKFIRNMIKKFYEYNQNKSQKKLIDGHIVMKKFSLPPGPLIGKILKLVQENQALGKIHTRDEALKLIDKYLPRTYEG